MTDQNRPLCESRQWIHHFVSTVAREFSVPILIDPPEPNDDLQVPSARTGEPTYLRKSSLSQSVWEERFKLLLNSDKQMSIFGALFDPNTPARQFEGAFLDWHVPCNRHRSTRNTAESECGNWQARLYRACFVGHMLRDYHKHETDLPIFHVSCGLQAPIPASYEMEQLKNITSEMIDHLDRNHGFIRQFPDACLRPEQVHRQDADEIADVEESETRNEGSADDDDSELSEMAMEENNEGSASMTSHSQLQIMPTTSTSQLPSCESSLIEHSRADVFVRQHSLQATNESHQSTDGNTEMLASSSTSNFPEDSDHQMCSTPPVTTIDESPSSTNAAESSQHPIPQFLPTTSNSTLMSGIPPGVQPFLTVPSIYETLSASTGNTVSTISELFHWEKTKAEEALWRTSNDSGRRDEVDFERVLKKKKDPMTFLMRRSLHAMTGRRPDEYEPTTMPDGDFMNSDDSDNTADSDDSVDSHGWIRRKAPTSNVHGITRNPALSAANQQQQQQTRTTPTKLLWTHHINSICQEELQAFPILARKNRLRVIGVLGMQCCGKTTLIHNMLFERGYSLTEEQLLESKGRVGLMLYYLPAEELLIIDCCDSIDVTDCKLAPPLGAFYNEMFTYLVADRMIYCINVENMQNAGLVVREWISSRLLLLHSSAATMSGVGSKCIDVLMRRSHGNPGDVNPPSSLFHDILKEVNNPIQAVPGSPQQIWQSLCPKFYKMSLTLLHYKETDRDIFSDKYDREFAKFWSDIVDNTSWLCVNTQPARTILDHLVTICAILLSTLPLKRMLEAVGKGFEKKCAVPDHEVTVNLKNMFSRTRAILPNLNLDNYSEGHPALERTWYYLNVPMFYANSILRNLHQESPQREQSLELALDWLLVIYECKSLPIRICVFNHSVLYEKVATAAFGDIQLYGSNKKWWHLLLIQARDGFKMQVATIDFRSWFEKMDKEENKDDHWSELYSGSLKLSGELLDIDSSRRLFPVGVIEGKFDCFGCCEIIKKRSSNQNEQLLIPYETLRMLCTGEGLKSYSHKRFIDFLQMVRGILARQTIKICPKMEAKIFKENFNRLFEVVAIEHALVLVEQLPILERNFQSHKKMTLKILYKLLAIASKDSVFSKLRFDMYKKLFRLGGAIVTSMLDSSVDHYGMAVKCAGELISGYAAHKSKIRSLSIKENHDCRTTMAMLVLGCLPVLTKHIIESSWEPKPPAKLPLCKAHFTLALSFLKTAHVDNLMYLADEKNTFHVLQRMISITVERLLAIWHKETLIFIVLQVETILEVCSFLSHLVEYRAKPKPSVNKPKKTKSSTISVTQQFMSAISSLYEILERQNISARLPVKNVQELEFMLLLFIWNRGVSHKSTVPPAIDQKYYQSYDDMGHFQLTDSSSFFELQLKNVSQCLTSGRLTKPKSEELKMLIVNKHMKDEEFKVKHPLILENLIGIYKRTAIAHGHPASCITAPKKRVPDYSEESDSEMSESDQDSPASSRSASPLSTSSEPAKQGNVLSHSITVVAPAHTPQKKKKTNSKAISSLQLPHVHSQYSLNTSRAKNADGPSEGMDVLLAAIVIASNGQTSLPSAEDNTVRDVPAKGFLTVSSALWKEDCEAAFMSGRSALFNMPKSDFELCLSPPVPIASSSSTSSVESLSTASKLPIMPDTDEPPAKRPRTEVADSAIPLATANQSPAKPTITEPASPLSARLLDDSAETGEQKSSSSTISNESQPGTCDINPPLIIPDCIPPTSTAERLVAPTQKSVLSYNEHPAPSSLVKINTQAIVDSAASNKPEVLGRVNNSDITAAVQHSSHSTCDTTTTSRSNPTVKQHGNSSDVSKVNNKSEAPPPMRCLPLRYRCNALPNWRSGHLFQHSMSPEQLALQFAVHNASSNIGNTVHLLTRAIFYLRNVLQRAIFGDATAWNPSDPEWLWFTTLVGSETVLKRHCFKYISVGANNRWLLCYDHHVWSNEKESFTRFLSKLIWIGNNVHEIVWWVDNGFYKIEGNVVPQSILQAALPATFFPPEKEENLKNFSVGDLINGLQNPENLSVFTGLMLPFRLVWVKAGEGMYQGYFESEARASLVFYRLCEATNFHWAGLSLQDPTCKNERQWVDAETKLSELGPVAILFNAH